MIIYSTIIEFLNFHDLLLRTVLKSIFLFVTLLNLGGGKFRYIFLKFVFCFCLFMNQVVCFFGLCIFCLFRFKFRDKITQLIIIYHDSSRLKKEQSSVPFQVNKIILTYKGIYFVFYLCKLQYKYIY